MLCKKCGKPFEDHGFMSYRCPRYTSDGHKIGYQDGIEFEAENGTTPEVTTLDDEQEKQQGEYKDYESKGTMYCIAFFKDGKVQGEYTRYHEDNHNK